MRLVDAAERVFARHETFHPRYGWFRKAHMFVGKDANIFTREDAPIKLGVGKNMVRAIRFWGTAAKLISKAEPARKGRASAMVSTKIGNKLLGPEGWDPFLEDPGSVWLLHWLMLARPSLLPVWWLAFNEFHAVEIDERELERVINAQLKFVSEWQNPSASSVKKDVRALLRTYAPVNKTDRVKIDDRFSCPFRDLGLMSRVQVSSRYRFVYGAKPTLPSSVVAFAAVDMVDRMNSGASTVTVSRLAHEPGGPGKVFKLTESDLRSALASFADTSSRVRLVSVAGASQINWLGNARDTADTILNDYYAQSLDSIKNGEAAK